MRYRRQAAHATAAVACVIGVVIATAGAASSDVSSDRHAERGSAQHAGTASASGKTGEGARTASAESGSTSATATRSALNSADREFVSMMIPHHYQAVLMTRWAPERSSDEDLLALADRINVEQNVEIDAMRGWQGRNGLPVTDAEESYQRVLQDPALVEEMGMATAAEMDELRAATGEQFDVLFLQLMIPHHEGAITMSEEILGTGRSTYVRQLAIDIISAQRDQIRVMEEMLDEKTG